MRVDPGSLGLITIVLAAISVGFKIWNRDRTDSSAPNVKRQDLQCVYIRQCSAISLFNFYTAARDLVATPFRGETRITWEN